MYYSKLLYKLNGFEKSDKQFKKYNAILENKQTGQLTKVGFGDTLYQQFKDSTGLGLYSNKDHNDPYRRALYRQRHAKDLKTGYWNAGLFSYKYLW
jgi:hypothetical protein